MLLPSACATKSAPSFPADERGCYLGVVPDDPLVVEAVKAWAPAAKPSDRLVSPACDDAKDEDLFNLTRRLLFKPPSQ